MSSTAPLVALPVTRAKSITRLAIRSRDCAVSRSQCGVCIVAPHARGGLPCRVRVGDRGAAVKRWRAFAEDAIPGAILPGSRSNRAFKSSAGAPMTGFIRETTPLVGREREQAALRDHLATALGGQGSLVLIGG